MLVDILYFSSIVCPHSSHMDVSEKLFYSCFPKTGREDNGDHVPIGHCDRHAEMQSSCQEPDYDHITMRVLQWPKL